jgi:hypothetical protein
MRLREFSMILQAAVISLVSSVAVVTICSQPFCVSAAETDTPGSSDRPRLPLPFGLRVEEHLLLEKPAGDVTKPFFVPVLGSEKNILKKHSADRERVGGAGTKVNIDNETLEAKEFYRAKAGGRNNHIGVQVIRKEKVVYSEVLGDQSPVNAIWGLWAYQKHWFLEVARCKTEERKEGNGISVYTDCNGDIIHDGKSVNKRNGYKESFGFQLMNGNPFHFFEKDQQIGISYGGEEALLGYAEIPHYYCCEPSMLNPIASQNMVSFFARRDNNWYYVEIGVFH